MKLVGGMACGLLVLVAAVAMGVAALAGGVGTALAAGAGAATGAGGPLPTALARATIPAAYLALYRRAAATCPGLPWTVLAAIGTVESDNGRSSAPGVASGSNAAGAEGPMQFEPATFAGYASPVPPGGEWPPSPYDPVDAVFAAARDLCANGAGGAGGLGAAVFAYNHAGWYVQEVLDLAGRLGRAPPATAGSPGTPGSGNASGASSSAVLALNFALGEIGAPYRWGGEGPGGFDCSGLVQAAYASAGVVLPRTAQAQMDAGPPVAPGRPLRPGDLVFFGPRAGDATHVGLVVRPGTMVDAPHRGASVRTEPFPEEPGAAWGSDVYLGATRPAAPLATRLAAGRTSSPASLPGRPRAGSR